MNDFKKQYEKRSVVCKNPAALVLKTWVDLFGVLSSILTSDGVSLGSNEIVGSC